MARGAGVAEFGVVAFVFQEPRQDAVVQRVGADFVFGVVCLFFFFFIIF